MYVPFWVFCSIVLFYVLLLCKCLLYYCQRVSTQLKLTNISYYILCLHVSAARTCAYLCVCTPVSVSHFTFQRNWWIFAECKMKVISTEVIPPSYFQFPTIKNINRESARTCENGPVPPSPISQNQKWSNIC